MSDLDNTAATAFDLDTATVEETFEVLLTHPNGDAILDADGQQIGITVYGPGSKAYSKATAARAQRMADRMARKGRIKLNAEQQLAEGAEFLAAVTVSFNRLTYQGKADRTAILAAYKNPALGYIADQVQTAVGDWTNFTKGGATS